MSVEVAFEPEQGEPAVWQVLEPGHSFSANDYRSGYCDVITFIHQVDGSRVEVYRSRTDNFNPQNVDPDDPRHEKKDWIESFDPQDGPYELHVLHCDRMGKLIVRKAFAVS